MDVMDFYYAISREDTFVAQATVFGHDVDLRVRNIKEIREMLNPPRLLRDEIYHQNRITFCNISFELTAFGTEHGLRMPVCPFPVYNSLAKVAKELTRCIDYANPTMAMDVASFKFLGVELYLTDYEMMINGNTLNMGAYPTLRQLEK